MFGNDNNTYFFIKKYTNKYNERYKFFINTCNYLYIIREKSIINIYNDILNSIIFSKNKTPFYILFQL